MRKHILYTVKGTVEGETVRESIAANSEYEARDLFNDMHLDCDDAEVVHAEENFNED